jgi:hypothetical protein
MTSCFLAWSEPVLETVLVCISTPFHDLYASVVLATVSCNPLADKYPTAQSATPLRRPLTATDMHSSEAAMPVTCFRLVWITLATPLMASTVVVFFG